jgi:hypothetical protein
MLHLDAIKPEKEQQQASLAGRLSLSSSARERNRESLTRRQQHGL